MPPSPSDLASLHPREGVQFFQSVRSRDRLWPQEPSFGRHHRGGSGGRHMRKLPEDYRLRQLRAFRKRLRQERKTRSPRRRKRFIHGGIDRRRTTVRPAPETVSLGSEFVHDTITFLENVSATLHKGSASVRVVLDFSPTTMITASGAVYLYSEIQRATTAYGWKSISIRHSDCTPFVYSQLQNSGLLRIANGTPAPRGRMPILAGQRNDQLEEVVKYVMAEAFASQGLADDVDFGRAEMIVGRAISEAMLNVQHHAYPNGPATRRWWLAATIINGTFYVAFCDRGVGMPTTLRTPKWHHRLGIHARHDAELIRDAMVYARSSKREHGRGYGTKDIQELVRELSREARRGGSLRIVSGQGTYRFRAENEVEELGKLDVNVHGTLIQWAMPLTQQGGTNEP